MKPQAKPKNNDFAKRIANLPPALDLIIAFPLAAYAGYILHSGEGSRGAGFMAIAVAFAFAGLGLNSVMRNMRELKILEQYSEPGLIRQLDEAKFERMLRAYYTTLGFMIEEPRDHGDDHDYDFILVKGKDRLLVRTRDWVEDKVPLGTLKKCWNAKRPVKATGIVIFTNGVFAEDALDWGSRQNIQMMNGQDIESAVLKEINGTEAKEAGQKKEWRLPKLGQEKAPVSPPPAPTVGSEPHHLFIDLNVMGKGGNLLQDLLKRHPKYGIVFTTRKDTPEDELKSMFPEVNDRFTGKTPDMPQYGASARYYEIVNFLAGLPLGHNAKWIALDQDPRAFPEGCDELVLASPHHGIDDRTIAALEDRMKILERRN